MPSFTAMLKLPRKVVIIFALMLISINTRATVGLFGAFSLVKRLMRESFSATKTKHMFHEMGLKFKFSNILINA